MKRAGGMGQFPDKDKFILFYNTYETRSINWSALRRCGSRNNVAHTCLSHHILRVTLHMKVRGADDLHGA